MQFENLTFTYSLFVTTGSGTANIKLNNDTILSQQLVRFGRQTVSAPISIPLGSEFNIELELVDVTSVRLENVMLTWSADVTYYDPYWMDRDDSPNIIWHYKDDAAGEIYKKSHSSPGVRTIPLDYETDGKPSFLRNYATVKSNGEIRDIKNDSGAHTFKGTGSFILPGRAPISYWLLERLFVAI